MQNATPSSQDAQQMAELQAGTTIAATTAASNIHQEAGDFIKVILEELTNMYDTPGWESKPDWESIQVGNTNVYKGVPGEEGKITLTEKQAEILAAAKNDPASMKGTLKVKVQGQKDPVFQMTDGKVVVNKLQMEILEPRVEQAIAPPEQTIIEALQPKQLELGVQPEAAPKVTNEDLMEQIKGMNERIQALEARVAEIKSPSEKVGKWMHGIRNNLAEKLHKLGDRVAVKAEELKPVIKQKFDEGMERQAQAFKAGWEKHEAAVEDYIHPAQPVEAVIDNPVASPTYAADEALLKDVMVPRTQELMARYEAVPGAITTLESGKVEFNTRDYSFIHDPRTNEVEFLRNGPKGKIQITPQNMNDTDRALIKGIDKKMESMPNIAPAKVGVAIAPAKVAEPKVKAPKVATPKAPKVAPPKPPKITPPGLKP